MARALSDKISVSNAHLAISGLGRRRGPGGGWAVPGSARQGVSALDFRSCPGGRGNWAGVGLLVARWSHEWAVSCAKPSETARVSAILLHHHRLQSITSRSLPSLVDCVYSSLIRHRPRKIEYRNRFSSIRNTPLVESSNIQSSRSLRSLAVPASLHPSSIDRPAHSRSKHHLQRTPSYSAGIPSIPPPHSADSNPSAQPSSRLPSHTLSKMLGRLTHYAVDAVLISTILAGMRRSTGLTLKTDRVSGESKDMNKWVEKYLGVGEWVMDQSVAVAGTSGWFHRTR